MNESDFVYSLSVEQRKVYHGLKKEFKNNLLEEVISVCEKIADDLEVEEASGAHSVRREIEEMKNS